MIEIPFQHAFAVFVHFDFPRAKLYSLPNPLSKTLGTSFKVFGDQVRINFQLCVISQYVNSGESLSLNINAFDCLLACDDYCRFAP